MSMIGNFLLVADAEIEGLLEAPETIHHVLDDRVYKAEVPTDYVDVEKAWHALHFLLTGTAWEGDPPLNFIATGGVPIGDEDVGYGPARALRSAEVAALSLMLAAIPPDGLVKRYDGQRMEELELYPGGWAQLDPSRGDEFGYFSAAYEDVRALVQTGAASGRGLLVWLN